MLGFLNVAEHAGKVSNSRSIGIGKVNFTPIAVRIAGGSGRHVLWLVETNSVGRNQLIDFANQHAGVVSAKSEGVTQG